MARKLTAIWMAILVCAGAACAMAEGGVAFTDMAGREIRLDAPAKRVVVIAAADLEILYALGAQDAIVGRGEYCDYPEGASEIPAVNSGAQMNIEQILALEPEIALLPYMSQSIEQSEALEAAGVIVVNTNAQDIEGVYRAIEMIGAMTAKDAEAAALEAEMRAVFAEIGEKSVNTGKTVYFEVFPLEWGLWTAGKNTFMDELAALCGLENAFPDVDGWGEISQEQVIARNPDYIVTIYMGVGEEVSPDQEIASRAGWEGITAIQNGDILIANSDEVTRPGPRLANAAKTLFDFINGESAAE